MSWRSTAVLLILLLGLGLFYYFYEIEGGKEREQVKNESMRLFPGIKPEDVSELFFKRTARITGDATIEGDSSLEMRFAATDGRWSILEPVRTRGDQSAISDLVSEVIELKSEKEITGQDLTAYGLDQPAFTIEFVYASEKGEPLRSSCRIGDQNPTGQYLYASAQEPPRLVMIPSSIKDGLIKPLMNYRDKKVLDFALSDVRRFSYQVRDNPAIRMEKTGDDWEVLNPVNSKGDASRIEEMLVALQNHSTTKFFKESFDPADPIEMQSMGFDTPFLTIQLELQDSASVARLVIGRHSDEGGKFRFAFRDGFEPVFQVTDELAAKFSPDVFTVQNKEICRFEKEKVARIRLKNSHGSFLIEHSTDGAWQLIEPRRIATDSPAVGSLLSDIAYLKASGMKSSSTGPVLPYITVSLFAAGEESPFSELVIGQKPEDGVGRFAVSCTGGLEFIVSDSDAERLDKSEFDLRDKDLMVFERDDLEEIRIQSSGKTVAFKPSGTGFSIVEPQDSRISSEDMDRLFWTVNHIRMTSIVSENEADLQKYGLEKPRFTLTTRLKTKVLGPLFIGSESEDDSIVYVSLKDSGLICGVPKITLTDLLSFSPDPE